MLNPDIKSYPVIESDDNNFRFDFGADKIYLNRSPIKINASYFQILV